VNRLTKKISLVLISSSLVLHGCHTETLEEEKKKEEEKQAAAAGTPGTSHGVSHGHYHRSTPFFFHSGSSPRSSTGFSSGSSPSSGARSTAGSSARGGFGGSGHGVSS
jgi:hypothetical protein